MTLGVRSIALLLSSSVQGHASAAGQKAVVWAPCADAHSLAAASTWRFGSDLQLQLVAASSSEEEGLCLTQPGKENTKGWGQPLEVVACNPEDAGQRWAMNHSMLQFEGSAAAAAPGAVCVAPYQYPGPPWPAAAAYPCQHNWDFMLTTLAAGGPPPGAIKLQMSAPKGKICLSYTDPAGPSPPPAPIAPVPLPSAAQLAYQRQELVCHNCHFFSCHSLPHTTPMSALGAGWTDSLQHGHVLRGRRSLLQRTGACARVCVPPACACHSLTPWTDLSTHRIGRSHRNPPRLRRPL